MKTSKQPNLIDVLRRAIDSAAANEPRRGLINGQPVRIVTVLSDRFRVAGESAIRLPGRCRLVQAGETALVPKRLVEVLR